MCALGRERINFCVCTNDCQLANAGYTGGDVNGLSLMNTFNMGGGGANMGGNFSNANNFANPSWFPQGNQAFPNAQVEQSTIARVSFLKPSASLTCGVTHHDFARA